MFPSIGGPGVQWGQQPPEEGPHKVRCWTPDPKKYFPSAHGTVIPRSRGKTLDSHIGASMGFDPGAHPFNVYVNDDFSANPTKVATVDPKALTARNSRRLFDQIAAQIEDPEERALAIYAALGANVNAPISGPQVVRQETNPFQPDRYVVPKSTSNGSQIVGNEAMAPKPQQQAAQPSQPQYPLTQPPVAQPQQAAPPQPQAPPQPLYRQQPEPPQAVYQMPPQQQVTTYAPVDYGPVIQQMQRDMASMQQGFAEALGDLRNYLMPRQAPAPAPPSSSQQYQQPAGTLGTWETSSPQANMPVLPELEIDSPEEEARQPAQQSRPEPTKPQAEYTRDELKRYTLAAVDKAMEKLNIPGLTFQPNEPSFEVSFDFGDMGETDARYHWVGVESGGLFLVYDKRFRYGHAYVPPNLGQSRFVNVRVNGQTYKCASTKFVHNFGVFKIVNLVVVGESGASSPHGTPQMTEIVPPFNMDHEHDDLDFLLGRS